MEPKDKKEIAEIMDKVIDAKVTPRLERLEKKLDATFNMSLKTRQLNRRVLKLEAKKA
jgi:hypothetical protein